LRGFTADEIISVDSVASSVNEAECFGYFGDGLGKWVQDHLNQGQLSVMGGPRRLGAPWTSYTC
jgi:hypothetical protein